MRRCFHALQFILISVAAVLFDPIAAAAQERPPALPLNLSYLRMDFILPGARQASLGGAFIGAAQDVTAAAINPAGLAYLRSVEATLHQRLGHHEFDVATGLGRDTKISVGNHNFDQTLAGVFLPLKRLSFALFRQLAIDTYYNFETQQFLDTTFARTPEFTLGGRGNYAGRIVNFDFELVHDAFSVAFNASKALSVGLTVKNSTLNLNMNERLFLDPQVLNGEGPRTNSDTTLYSINTIHNRKNKFSYSLGLMSTILTDRLFFGAVVNFNPTYDLESNLYFPAYRLGASDLPAETMRPNFDLSIPDSYGFGFYFLLNSRVRFSLDVQRIEYSDLLSGHRLDVLPEFGGASRDITVSDGTHLHTGVEWLFIVPQLRLNVPMRFGAHLNPGHQVHRVNSEDEYLGRLYPDVGARLHLTFGAGFTFKDLKFDSAIAASKDGYEFWASGLLTVPVDY